MNNTTFIIILLLDVVIAYFIAKYQQRNGYSFSKSFIGALIGIVGLTLLAIKGVSSV